MKRILKTLEGLSDEVKKEYQKLEDGAYELIIEGGDDLKAKINEFRSRNIELLKAQEGAKTKSDEAQTKLDMLTAEIAGLKDGKKKDIKKGDQDNEQITQLAGQIKELQDLMKAKDEKQAVSDKRLATEKIRSGLTHAIQSVAILKKGALEYALRCGESVFSLDDQCNPVAMRTDGSLLLNNDGEQASFSDFAKMLVEDAKFLFEDNKGGEGHGNNRKGEQPGGVKVVPMDSFMSNLDDIAEGESTVEMESDA